MWQIQILGLASCLFIVNIHFTIQNPIIHTSTEAAQCPFVSLFLENYVFNMATGWCPRFRRARWKNYVVFWL